MVSRDSSQKISLNQIVHNIKHLKEYPTPDNNDWLVPDYWSFHKKQRPSFFARLWNRFFLASSLQHNPFRQRTLINYFHW